MARIVAWEDIGDGRIRIMGESDKRNPLSLVVGRNMLGTSTLALMIDKLGVQTDATADALDARRGRSDVDET